ncbi:MAG: hypothetical protein WD575_00555 [Nitriliruptoraceae bacterium]
MSAARRYAGTRGSLSLESVLLLPLLAVIVAGLLQLTALLTDTLLVHEAARAAVRVAATTSEDAAVVRAATGAAPELVGLQVTVTPSDRRSGDVVRVEASVVRTLGGVEHTLRASGHARVEPAVR